VGRDRTIHAREASLLEPPREGVREGVKHFVRVNIVITLVFVAIAVPYLARGQWVAGGV
jgi:hypothetical protein